MRSRIPMQCVGGLSISAHARAKKQNVVMPSNLDHYFNLGAVVESRYSESATGKAQFVIAPICEIGWIEADVSIYYKVSNCLVSMIFLIAPISLHQ